MLISVNQLCEKVKKSSYIIILNYIIAWLLFVPIRNTLAKEHKYYKNMHSIWCWMIINLIPIVFSTDELLYLLALFSSDVSLIFCNKHDISTRIVLLIAIKVSFVHWQHAFVSAAEDE